MLYTRKGDNGTTKLFNSKPGERITKGAFIFEALGNVDELNSGIGFAKTLAKEDNFSLENIFTYEDFLEEIQENLFSIQAELASDTFYLKLDHISFLENRISEVEKFLPTIDSFIISGGTQLGAYLDVLRAVSRRVERSLVILSDKKEKEVNPISLQYLNRLSSVLYALARYANYKKGFPYKKPNYK